EGECPLQPELDASVAVGLQRHDRHRALSGSDVMTSWRRLADTAWLACAVATTARGQSPTPPDSIVATRQQITIGGKTLHYVARAGQLPLLVNDTGEDRKSTRL